jgi:hypothetical protein
MLSRRSLFSVVAAGIAAIATFKPIAIFAATSEPSTVSGVLARMAKLKAKREAEPAAHWFNTNFREVNGLSRVPFPPIYGDGKRDDEPGFTAILTCKQRGGSVSVSEHRVYRAHKPLPARGNIEFCNPGEGNHHIYSEKLSKPIAPGRVRLFWYERTDQYGFDGLKVVDVLA